VLPIESNPIVEPPSLDYDPIGPNRPANDKGPAADADSLDVARTGWKTPLLVLAGAILGAILVFAVLTLAGVFRPSPQPIPQGSNPNASGAVAPTNQR
jgi:hypothetical protein